MAEPFIAQIVMFGGNFAPRGWAFCDGQLLSISSNTALFSILGTMYGGDGRTTFALPELRGRVAIHQGSGPGLPNYNEGARGGSPTHTLTTGQLPAHSHASRGNKGGGDSTNPSGGVPANSAVVDEDLYHSTSNINMGNTANAGGGQSFSIMQPYLAINFIIALVGIFPSRN